jgi:1,4-alpha-glucan branching enzyme
LPAPSVEDPEFKEFKSSLPQIEMNKKMVINVEREFADRKYDIRIFEVTIKHAKNQTKYQFEMFAVDLPQVVFKADFVCQGQMQGKKLLIERFNIIGQLQN